MFLFSFSQLIQSNIQIACLHLTRITVILRRDKRKFMIYRWILFRKRNFFGRIFRRNGKSQFKCNNFLSENYVVCEIKWKNVVKTDTEAWYNNEQALRMMVVNARSTHTHTHTHTHTKYSMLPCVELQPFGKISTIK